MSKYSDSTSIITIRRIAVRETGVSRHHGERMERPPETPRTSQHYPIEGFKRVLHYAERWM